MVDNVIKPFESNGGQADVFLLQVMEAATTVAATDGAGPDVIPPEAILLFLREQQNQHPTETKTPQEKCEGTLNQQVEQVFGARIAGSRCSHPHHHCTVSQSYHYHH